MTSAPDTTALEPDPRADVTGGDADSDDVKGAAPNGEDPDGADPLGIDRLVHEPARMAILSVLDGVSDAELGSWCECYF